MQGTALMVAYWIGGFVESVSERNSDALITSLYGIMFALAIGQMIRWLFDRCLIRKILFDFEGHISQVTLTKVLRFSLGQIVNQNSGFKQETLKKGEVAIAELVQTLFIDAIPAIIRIVTTVIALFFIHYTIGLAAMISITLFVAVSLVMNQRMMPKIKKNRKRETELSTYYWEMIKHLRLVMVSAQEKRAIREYKETFDEYGEDGKNIWTTYVGQVSFLREPCALVGQVLVYALAARLVWQGQITLGDLVVVMGWTSIAFAAVAFIGHMQRRLVRNFTLVGRYFDLLEIPPAITEIQNPIRLSSFKEQIELQNVCFAYPKFNGDDAMDEDCENKSNNDENGPVALHDISLTIERGSVVAFVGHSGSGKSTVINLLQRGYDPDSGSILVDGHDLRNLHLESWRKGIGIVEQDPKLWDDTLRYNILYGLNGSANDISEGELKIVASQAKIDEFYHRLDVDPFSTLIGENGIQLSGGQRQRVAIARAIIKNPEILILDEATNALDTLNEKLVHTAIREALKGRTGIIIAHRLSTIRTADKIIVFEKGRIVGVGKHSELLQSCKQYQELVSHEISLC